MRNYYVVLTRQRTFEANIIVEAESAEQAAKAVDSAEPFLGKKSKKWEEVDSDEPIRVDRVWEEAAEVVPDFRVDADGFLARVEREKR